MFGWVFLSNLFFMKLVKQFILSLALIAGVTSLSAQNTSHVQTDNSGINGYSKFVSIFNANNKPTPFWFYANNSGRYGRSFLNQQAWINFLSYSILTSERIKINVGLEGDVHDQLNSLVLNQFFLNLHYRKFLFRVGKEEFTLAQYNDELGVGSMFLSKNSRPIPRVGAGFYDYVPVPFWKDKIMIKGAIHIGRLNDDRGEKGIRHPWLHEKFFYVKTARPNFNFWIGMNHAVLMGGTAPDGTKIPVDIWASFFGLSSDKFKNLFPGEETNVAGAHFGLFDFGSELDFRNWHADMYYQKPIEDGSGLRSIFNLKHDRIFGLNLVNKTRKYISQILFEYINTDYQSGEGTTSNPVSSARDDYYNNWLYSVGNSFYGQSIGIPLFLTQNDINFIEEIDELPFDRFFINNRIIAFHFGVIGWLNERIRYKIIETYSKNHGTYSGLYGGPFAFEEQADYFFKKSKNQHYFLLELKYTLDPFPLEFELKFGKDRGKLSNGTAISMGVMWSI